MTPTKRLLTGTILVTALIASGCRSHHPERVVTIPTPPAAVPVYTGPTTTPAQSSAAIRMAWDQSQWIANAKPQPLSVSPAAPKRQPLPLPNPPDVSPGDAADAVANHFGDMFGSAWAVSECESHHDPSAISAGGGNWGLFQINRVHRDSFEAVTGQPWVMVLNAEANARFARWLYDSSGGWGPWACKWAA